MFHFKYYFCNLPTDESSLEQIAFKLGVSMHLVPLAAAGNKNTREMQSRIQESLRHRRDSLLWLIALIPAVASVFSAGAAWRAVAGC